MSYTNAIFYLDYVNGSDTARTDLHPTVYENNGSGLVRVTVDSNSLVTGAVVTIAGTSGSYYVGAWKITVFSATQFDLVGSTFTSNPGTKGTCIPFGADSWSNAWKTITSGATVLRIAAGDIVRIAKSPVPTVKPSINIIDSTDASPISIHATAHGLTSNDSTVIAGHLINIAANGTWVVTVTDVDNFTLNTSTGSGAGVGGATGTSTQVGIGRATWTNLSKTVTLAASQSLNICMCEADWTTVNATSAAKIGTDWKEGTYAVKIVEDATPAANEVQAYFATGALDLSLYQKISFWIKNEVAIADGSTWIINLYTSADASGVAVDSFAIPAIPSIGRWIPLSVTKTGGGNLNANINSIAIINGTTTPTASKYVYLDNIIACTSTGLNLQSLISKNTLEQSTTSATNYGNEAWHGIQSINGTTVLLDNETNTLANVGKGYSTTGTTPETVNTYIRETIKTSLATSAATQIQAIQNSGTIGNEIQFQGGYDTGTSSQTGETYFDGLNGFGCGLYSAKYYLIINHINFCRYDSGYNFNVASGFITVLTCNINNNLYGIYCYGYNDTFTTIINANNNTNGFYFYYTNNNNITTIYNLINNTYGINFTGSDNNTIDTISNANNNTHAIFGGVGSSSNNNIGSLTSRNNSTSGVNIPQGKNYIQNWPVGADGATASTSYSNSKLFVNNLLGTGYAKIFTDGGNIVSQASTLTHGSGTEWKFTTETNTNRNSGYPLKLTIAKIAVNSGTLVTATCWFKKGHETNIAAALVCRSGQLTGVAPSNVICPGDTNENNLSISFTPGEVGVVEIEAWVWYVAAHSTVIVDAMTITQV
jgi:hypothetical protein